MDINYYKQFEPIDGKWYITKVLGSGAFGTVFEIQRKDFSDMKAALKVISVPNSQSEYQSFCDENFHMDGRSVTSYFFGFVEEFVKEFKVMYQLKGHSNIVGYEDHDVIPKKDGFGWDIFIRLELLTPVPEYFKSCMPSVQEIIKLGIDICCALEVCQKHNIIHRDIKPSNIFVSPNGDYKLGDFGVARTLEHTSSGLSKKGTYTYMAPEVFKGDSYNATVDIYSLGIVLYRLLNDNFEPFRTSWTYSDGEAAMAKRINGEPIPPPVNAPSALAEVVLKACSYMSKDRYQTATQMREALERVLRELNGGGAEKMAWDAGKELGTLQEKSAGTFGGDLSVQREETVGLFSSEYSSVKSVEEPVSFYSSEYSSVRSVEEPPREESSGKFYFRAPSIDDL